MQRWHSSLALFLHMPEADADEFADLASASR